MTHIFFTDFLQIQCKTLTSFFYSKTVMLQNIYTISYTMYAVNCLWEKVKSCIKN